MGTTTSHAGQAIITAETDAKTVFALLAQGRVDAEQFTRWESARLEATAARASAAAKAAAWANGNGRAPTLSLKIGKSGCLVIGGFGQFPVNLYPEQLYRLVGAIDQLDEFACEHLDKPWVGEVRLERGGPVTTVSRTVSTRNADRLASYRDAAIQAAMDWAADRQFEREVSAAGLEKLPVAA